MKLFTLITPARLALLVTTLCLVTVPGSGPACRVLPLAAPPLAAEGSLSGDAGHGRKLFVQSCAHCHGDDARGSGEDGEGPDLFRLAIGNARIAAVIRGGIPDEMPSFAKKHHAPDIADLTSYLRTLR